jgi:hypothetical protein
MVHVALHFFGPERIESLFLAGRAQRSYAHYLCFAAREEP